MDIILIILNLVVFFFLVLIFFKQRSFDLSSIQNQLQIFEKSQERLEKGLKDDFSKIREETNTLNRMMREELSKSVLQFSEAIRSQISDISNIQKNQLDTFARQLNLLTQSMEQRLERVRETVEQRLKLLQDDTGKRLEEMRGIVDEKLQATLEKRLGESFKLVSERLEQVHRGLGEMQILASSVGDLKKVLSNVKTRGTWGEVQLGTLLDQILTKDQYATNVVTKKGSNERVEFAIKLPGKNDDVHTVWLPVDAKFPQEDYQRLLNAYDSCDEKHIEEIRKQLERNIKKCANDIKDKYLDPPNTTDFAILFLPVEGLYAEVLRLPDVIETLQRDYRVVVSGPTTFAAFLNSLQMGFRTLAIEKRSSEVWKLLGAVKTEFNRFGTILEDASKKLLKAHESIDDAVKRTRTIERRLKDVQELSQTETTNILEEK